MKFACPKCGSQEEIIADKKPLCLRCRTGMLQARVSYTGLLMKPEFVIRRMRKIVEKFGKEASISDGLFKQEREAWTSAVWALGIAEETQRDYWVEIVNPVEQTPDTKVHWFDQSKGHNNLMTHNLEIVDWEEHVEEPLQLVQQKCRKAYPPYFSLLMLVRSGKVLKLDKLISEVSTLTVPFGEIWIVGRESDSGIRLEMVHPGPKQIAYDLNAAFRKTKSAPDFLVREKRGKRIKFRDKGDLYLPIPLK